MLKWLRKLMAGDQGAEPPQGEAEQDEQGRITRVSQTLSRAEEGADGTTHPVLVPDDSLTPRLREACDWLIGQNIRLAREQGLGLERNYDFDQDTGKLILKFARGRTIAARAQILGSFDPRTGASCGLGPIPPSCPRSARMTNARRLKESGSASPP